MVTASLLDGKHVATQLLSRLSDRREALELEGLHPGLATIVVGSDPASKAYVAGKHRDCEVVGIRSIKHELPATASQSRVTDIIDSLNADPRCTGLIVQLPLPPDLDTHAILERIHPSKDADGLHPENLGRLVLGRPAPLPCTPRGILELLRWHDIEITGRQFCVIGCGMTVGRPLGLMLTRPSEHATVTLCHEATVDVAAHARVADVVVAAVGVAHLVQPNWIKPGATVLSVGITRTIEGILGDVHPDVANVAGSITQATGGVGPMTRAMLLTNIVEAAERVLTAGRA